MISYIKGDITDFGEDNVVVESAGIGYIVYCSTTDIEFFRDNCKGVTVYTHLSHKEDSMTLYGFSTAGGRAGFLQLLKVDGVGPKLALKMMSYYTMKELWTFINNEDIANLKKIPGVGQKMVSKLIFDLKGKIISTDNALALVGIESDLLSALTNMGYNEFDVRNIIKDNKPESKDFEKEFKRYIKILTGR